MTVTSFHFGLGRDDEFGMLIPILVVLTAELILQVFGQRLIPPADKD